MSNTIRIKRSAVAGKVPTTGDLQLGELALNTFDGKLYTRKDNGAASIVEIGATPSAPWSTYATQWDTPPTETSPGVFSYLWQGVTRYRTIPEPYVASGDAFYSDAGLTSLIIARA